MLKKSFSRGRRQETGDNPPLAPPPPRRGEMGMSEEVVGKLSQDCSAQLCA
ncbi:MULTISPECIES: hypothetical protein [Okeania]|uniref:hypothetical protein n=1 Tax=Okeania TaxID=1458928 RepID=UPI001374F7D7|nr:MULTISPECIES: hypothetical protein [Okeania]NET13113.1 hypothetical protein [Okeania sp. SIO1H6]NES76497.1 hypothetical protein [Okeania sp. SIO1H4]NES89904.1 hypothetical protein [Okeania sp. SIO2B9]NET20363.1 hypothetical protein [Okeania sp. SIO1H5]NET77048.1 hypothetical protein [Okeania sp. SIO1F9]